MIHGHALGTALLAYVEKQRNTQASSTPSLFLIFQVKLVRKKIAREYSRVSSLLACLCSKPFLILCEFDEKVGTRAKTGNGRGGGGERSIFKYTSKTAVSCFTSLPFLTTTAPNIKVEDKN